MTHIRRISSGRLSRTTLLQSLMSAFQLKKLWWSWRIRLGWIRKYDITQIDETLHISWNLNVLVLQHYVHFTNIRNVHFKMQYLSQGPITRKRSLWNRKDYGVKVMTFWGNIKKAWSRKNYWRSGCANFWTRCGQSVDEYFASVSVKPDHRPCQSKVTQLSQEHARLLNLGVSEDEVLLDLDNIDFSKPAGPDGITPIVQREMRLFLFIPLTKLIRKSSSDGMFPKCESQKCTVSTSTKESKVETVCDLRAIYTVYVLSKICEKIVHTRLTNYLSHITCAMNFSLNIVRIILRKSLLSE